MKKKRNNDKMHSKKVFSWIKINLYEQNNIMIS